MVVAAWCAGGARAAAAPGAEEWMRRDAGPPRAAHTPRDAAHAPPSAPSAALGTRLVAMQPGHGPLGLPVLAYPGACCHGGAGAWGRPAARGPRANALPLPCTPGALATAAPEPPAPARRAAHDAAPPAPAPAPAWAGDAEVERKRLALAAVER